MSVFRKIISWTFFWIFALILIGVTYIIYCWANCNCIETKVYKTFSNDKNAKVAVFKADTEQMPKIRMQRFLLKEQYRYPFYSPQFYSNNFFIDFKLTDTMTFVVDDKDTIRWGELYVIDTVPSRMKGYGYSGILRVTYYQDTLFQSNIEHMPEILLQEQITIGPISPDCYKRCD